MERSKYLILRSTVELEVIDQLGVTAESNALINSIMRHFLSFSCAEVVQRNKGRLALRSFRRDPNAQIPGWAYREPGIRPKYNPVR